MWIEKAIFAHLNKKQKKNHYFSALSLAKATLNSYNWRASFGGMAEWLKAHAWKACLPNGNEGSNPSPSSKTFKVVAMSDQRVYLDDIYASKESQGSVFRAVVMMAQEARFINDQARLGFIQLNKKPTTIAMYKFKEGKLSISDKVDEDSVLDIQAPTDVSDEAASDLF